MKQAQKIQEKQAENASLRAEILAQKQTISEKEKTISALEEQVLLMQARIEWYNRQEYGRKSEKLKLDDPNQLCIDFDWEQKQPEVQAEPEQETITYTRKKNTPDVSPCRRNFRVRKSSLSQPIKPMIWSALERK